MIDVLAFLIGVLIAIAGLGVSIALHEVGHLFFAKRFGVRVPQFMVGFGPTLWSRRRGETEYGVKALPLGGYISMIGMFPPQHGERVGAQSTGFFSQLIEDGREASAESIPPGEEHRAYYRLPVWQRLLIMLGGPLMNLVVAIVCFTIVVGAFGVYESSTTVAQVHRCIAPADAAADVDPDDCTDLAPGHAAGIEPGDRILSIGGVAAADWATVQRVIRASADEPIAVVVERAGVETTLTAVPAPTAVAVRDELTGRPLVDDEGLLITETVGFLGISPAPERVRKGPDAAVELAWQQSRAVVDVIVTMPQRVVDMFRAAFLGAERDPYGPVSIVGVGAITGQIAQQHEVPIADRAATMIG
ncbi:MAG: site-2 protease family protein, partial [Microbacteriaceae bacterium]|nr:site-2 protease family protein [Microbacteriaceae bacterium]